MEINELTSSHNSNKWHEMLAIVNEHPELIQNNLGSQHKKMRLSRLLAENIFIFLLQYTGLMFSTISNGVHPVWIASGAACAFVFLRGISIIPGIWFGSFFAFISALPIENACTTAAIFTLQPLVLLVLNYRFLKSPRPDFYHVHTLFGFMLTTAITASITSALLIISLSNQTQYLSQVFTHWFLANFNGTFIFTYAIITWDEYFSEPLPLSSIKKIMLGLIYSILTTQIILMCLTDSTLITSGLSVTIFLNIIFISRYLGWCGAVGSVALLATSICFFAYVSSPFFSADSDPYNILMLDILITGSAIFSFMIGIKTSYSNRYISFNTEVKIQ